MGDPVVLVDVDDAGVGVLTLNRPEARNALNGALLAALRREMSELDGRADVAVIIVTGSDPAFCAGLDLKEMGGPGPPTSGRTGDAPPPPDPARAGAGPWA